MNNSISYENRKIESSSVASWIGMAVVSLFCCFFLTSCETTGLRDIEGSDDGTFFPSIRATYEIDNISILPRDHGNAKTHSALELDLSHGSGSSSQRLGNNELIELDNARLTGPGNVDVDYDIVAGSLSLAQSAEWFSGTAAVTGLAGFGFTDLNLDLASGTGSIGEDYLSVGFILGAGVTLRPIDRLTLSGRASVTLGIGPDTAYLGSAELVTEVMATQHLGVFAGWRWWDYSNADSDSSNDSEIDLELSGPVAGLSLRF